MFAVNVSVTVLYTVRRLSTYNLQYIHTYVCMYCTYIHMYVCGTWSQKKATEFDNLPWSTTAEVIDLNILSTTVSCSLYNLMEPDAAHKFQMSSHIQ